jgi:hypothetical protein
MAGSLFVGGLPGSEARSFSEITKNDRKTITQDALRSPVRDWEMARAADDGRTSANLTMKS